MSATGSTDEQGGGGPPESADGSPGSVDRPTKSTDRSPKSAERSRTPDAAGHHAGYVALVGRPNVGKSTLLNAMLDHKLSIVTPTPQTTRQRILGILSREHYQMVFLDTPGILEPRYELQRRMLDQAFAAVGDADVVLVLVEAREPLRPRELALLPEVVERAGGRPVLVAINKIDRFAKPKLLPMIAQLAGIEGVGEVVPISALHDDGVRRLETVLAGHLPASPPYFPPDALSDQPERFFVAEMIREKVFQRYGQEIPFSTAVQITTFEVEEGRKVHLCADIVVERESQKAILIGRGGAALKEVGRSARLEIERFLDQAVYLELHVRVRARWRSDARFLRELGL